MNASWTKYLPKALRERIEGQQQLKKIIGTSGWLFSEKIIRILFGFTVGAWTARYLGPDRIGQLSYAASFVGLFAIISQLGLDSIVIRNIVHDPSDSNKTLGSTFILKLIGSVVVFGLIMITIYLLRPDDKATHLIVAITAIGTLFHAFSTIDLWFQSQVLARYAAWGRISAFLAITVVKVCLILLKAPVTAFAWAGVADVALGSIGLIIAYRAYGFKISSWSISWAMSVNLLRNSWPLLFSDLLIFIYMRIDKIMIGDMAGNTELGIYSIAAYITEILYFIPTIIAATLFPSIIEAKNQNEELFYSRLQRFYNLMAFAGYCIAVPVTVLAGWLIPFFFGASYSRAVPMLIGLVWVSTFIHFMIARSYFLTAMNWTRLHLIIDVIGCLLSVTLYYLLIPRYGGMGAVIASCIAYWFVTHGICFLYRPLFRTGVMMTKALLYPKFW